MLPIIGEMLPINKGVSPIIERISPVIKGIAESVVSAGLPLASLNPLDKCRRYCLTDDDFIGRNVTFFQTLRTSLKGKEKKRKRNSLKAI